MNIALLEDKGFVDKDRPGEFHGVIIGSLTEDFILTQRFPAGGSKEYRIVKLTDLLNCVFYSDHDAYQKALIPTLTVEGGQEQQLIKFDDEMNPRLTEKNDER